MVDLLRMNKTEYTWGKRTRSYLNLFSTSSLRNQGSSYNPQPIPPTSAPRYKTRVFLNTGHEYYNFAVTFDNVLSIEHKHNTDVDTVFK